MVGGMGFLSEVRLISRYGNFKNGCCWKVLGWIDRSGEMSVKAGTSKFREWTDRDLSTALTDCCRLCMHHIKWTDYFDSERLEIPKYELELSSH
ncbi:hypothetical protein AVEN_69393-1 [Araneus ventricosus]|uniref:Uncharacterized protein n=1 Tax=Araneus ventricosus TaxID=182803 RepID=A0A4Y2X8W7_ARAVE|nr:hypothetical protein AVEN_69393-1 [Araneus ventricosus]